MSRVRRTLVLTLAAAAVVGPPGDARAQERDLERQVGQMVVGRVEGTRPSAALLSRVRAGRLGGVILFSDNVRSRSQVRSLIARLQRAASAGGNPPLLVSVDQEGGLVRRLPWAAPVMSAARMGAAGPATARAQGRRSAAALRADGVTLNLAPVADVPSVAPSFLGTRAFGTTPTSVADAACAFADGLTGGGVAASFKHFPGLGAASGNTDLRAVTITAPLAQLRAGYRPYRRCAAGSRRLVMVASAAYRGLTGRTPAVLSPVVYRRELPRVGFTGATISDDLQANALRGRRDVEVRAARAGLDLLLIARTESGARHAFRRLLAAARRGALTRQRVGQANVRIARLKRQLR